MNLLQVFLACLDNMGSEMVVGRFDEESAMLRLIHAGNEWLRFREQGMVERAHRLGVAAYSFAFKCYEVFGDKSFWGETLNGMLYQTEQPTEREVDSR